MTDEQSNRRLVEAFFSASERGDLTAVADMLDDEMVMEWPQSGELFRGKENVLGAMRTQQTKPTLAGKPRLVGEGSHWVFTVPLRYGEDIQHYVAVLEVRGGRIRRGTGFWGAPFPAQEIRARFTDHG